MDARTIRRLRLLGVVSLGVCLAGASSCPKPCTRSGSGVILGTDGPDVLCGSPEVDYIYGGGGADELRGFGGDDVLYGEGGDDILRGGSGHDALYGDVGDDRLLGGDGSDLLNGGGGNDWADFSDSWNAVIVNLTAGVAVPSFGGGNSGSDTLISIRRVEGSSYNDLIYGDDTGNVLNGNGGDDYLLGGTDADTLRGGAGNDQLYGQNGPDTLEGNEGDDFLQGGRGADTINGGAGSFDWVSYADYPEAVAVAGGLGGNDSYGRDTLAGIESYEGSEFDDYLIPTSPETLRGLGGNDTLVGDIAKTTVDYSNASSGVTVHLGNGTASGGEDDDTLSGIRNIIGSWYDDSLTGEEHKNVILGGNGNDQLFGKAQDDTLDGEGGVDTADGGADMDGCIAETTINCE